MTLDLNACTKLEVKTSSVMINHELTYWQFFNRKELAVVKKGMVFYTGFIFFYTHV